MPSINTQYFFVTNSALYWTSTDFGPDSRYNTILFGGGTIHHFYVNSSYYVRCVRGTSINVGNFTNNNDGTITDNNINLMWQREDDNNTYTWEGALSYCENLTLSSYSDWRLPSMKEILTKADFTQASYPLLDGNYFIDAYVSGPYGGVYFWTSTTTVDNTSRAYSFYDYADFAAYDKTSPIYVRCVRN